MSSWRAWVASGRTIEVDGRRVFVRTAGPVGAPVLFFLHGFPTSSFDYEAVIERLADRYRCVAFDFLGFGASAKPKLSYDYELQTNLVEGVARAERIERATVVAHDYGVTVGQELLARDLEGRAAFAIAGMLFMNGGLCAALHRPIAVQRLLAGPFGPLISRLIFSESTFASSMRKIVRRMDRFDVHEHFASVASDGGAQRIPQLLGYIAERKRRSARWQGAIEKSKPPLAFAWGIEDPISGAHMLEWARKAAPQAVVTALKGVGHYPQIEDPESIAAAIDAFATAQS